MRGLKCVYCLHKITTTYISCTVCPNVKLCFQCFASGAEGGTHKKTHGYCIEPASDCVIGGIFKEPLNHSSWSFEEELTLLNAIESYGYGNWTEVGMQLIGRTPEECKRHYETYYINGTIGQFCAAHNETEELSLNISDHTLPLSSPVGPATVQSKTTNRSNMRLEECKLLGYSAIRDEFEYEYDNNAEVILAKIPHGSVDGLEKELQLALVDAYNRRLTTRIYRHQLAREHDLLTDFFSQIGSQPNITAAPRYTSLAYKRAGAGRGRRSAGWSFCRPRRHWRNYKRPVGKPNPHAQRMIHTPIPEQDRPFASIVKREPVLDYMDTCALHTQRDKIVKSPHNSDLIESNQSHEYAQSTGTSDSGIGTVDSSTTTTTTHSTLCVGPTELITLNRLHTNGWDIHRRPRSNSDSVLLPPAKAQTMRIHASSSLVVSSTTAGHDCDNDSTVAPVVFVDSTRKNTKETVVAIRRRPGRPRLTFNNNHRRPRQLCIPQTTSEPLYKLPTWLTPFMRFLSHMEVQMLCVNLNREQKLRAEIDRLLSLHSKNVHTLDDYQLDPPNSASVASHIPRKPGRRKRKFLFSSRRNKSFARPILFNRRRLPNHSMKHQQRQKAQTVVGSRTRGRQPILG